MNARQRRVTRRRVYREHAEWVRSAAKTHKQPWEHNLHLREYIASMHSVRKLHS